MRPRKQKVQGLEPARPELYLAQFVPALVQVPCHVHQQADCLHHDSHLLVTEATVHYSLEHREDFFDFEGFEASLSADNLLSFLGPCLDSRYSDNNLGARHRGM